MPYCITLRSRTDARITGWYDGSDSRWSTDYKRQKLFDKKREARAVCAELRSRCPRNAKAINIEAEQNEPGPDLGLPMFSPWVEYLIGRRGASPVVSSLHPSPER